MELKGKFQGDEFELLYAKVEKGCPILYITVSLGYTLEFDLSIHASVYEDTADVTNLILDYHKNIIIFKVRLRLLLLLLLLLLIILHLLLLLVLLYVIVVVLLLL